MGGYPSSALGPGYVDPNDAARKKAEAAGADEDAWWKTNEGIDAKGRELSMKAQGSESYESFKTRIFAELRKRQEAMEKPNAN
jgi:hypothetical protein